MKTVYIDYNGEKHPFRFSFLAIRDFQNETGKDVENLDEDYNLYVPFLKYGLKYGYKAENKEFNLKESDIELMLDEVFFKIGDIVQDFFSLNQQKSSKKK
jgi:hypothetical protein